MSIRDYLPSAKLVSIVFALALSVGLVYVADALTRPVAPPTIAVDYQAATDTDWEAALAAIQAQTASSSFAAPDPNFINNLLTAAQSQNITETVGRTLLINLSNAKSQGLGNDIPTQDQIVAVAAAQVSSAKNLQAHTLADLAVVATSPATLKAYGNGVMKIFNSHQTAGQKNTYIAIGNAVDSGDASKLNPLPAIQADYAALTADLLALPVPQTLAPFHLIVINDFARITASYDDMRMMISDPLRGLAGFQQYESSISEATRVFTNIAGAFSKEGIIFNKDEPGVAWNVFVST